MSWLVFATGSIVFFVLLGIFQRKLAVESTDVRASTAIFNVAAAILSIGIFIIGGTYSNFKLPTEPMAYVFLGIACLFYGLFERLRFRVSKILDASMVSVISNAGVMVAFTASVFLYGEAVTLEKILGAGLVILALIIVSFEKVSKVTLDGILLALVMEILLGIGWSLDKKGAMFFNYDTYNLFIWSLPLFIIMFFPRVKWKAIVTEAKSSSWRLLVLAGLNVVGYVLQLRAMMLTDATLVIPIVQTSSLFTVFAGIIFLGERQFIGRKILAGVVAVVGVFLLVGFKLG